MAKHCTQPRAHTRALQHTQNGKVFESVSRSVGGGGGCDSGGDGRRAAGVAVVLLLLLYVLVPCYSECIYGDEVNQTK